MSVFASSSAACSTLSSGPGVFPRPSLDERRNAARPAGSSLMTVIASSWRAYAPPRIVPMRQAKGKRGRDPPRHPHAFHGIHGRIERVEEQEQPNASGARNACMYCSRKMITPSAMTMSATLCASRPVERPRLGLRLAVRRSDFDSLCSVVIQFPASRG